MLYTKYVFKNKQNKIVVLTNLKLVYKEHQKSFYKSIFIKASNKASFINVYYIGNNSIEDKLIWYKNKDFFWCSIFLNEIKLS